MGENDAVGRRIGSLQQTPDAQIETGLGHLEQVGGGFDSDTFNSIIQPLLQAKHGIGGNADIGQKSQGQIVPGKPPDKQQNIGSIIGTVAALL